MMLLIIFGFIAFTLFIFFLGKWTWVSKGEMGEHYVSQILSSLNENEYKIFNDVMLRKSNDKTIQIDHIVISAYGIFVIETKNYSGWIFGNEKAEYWMQVIYNKKYKFRNPVKQNQAHVFVLKDIFAEYSDIKYFPIVVFVGDAKLKKIESKMPVIYDNDLLNLIYADTASTCLTETEIHKIVDLLSSKNIIDKKIRAEHINNIRQTIVERKLKMKNLICPRCNGQLKLRKGRSGKFYGCSNYPRCRFTMLSFE